MTLQAPKMFRWHESAKLCGTKDTDTSVPLDEPAPTGNIHFIADVDCESTLRSLRHRLIGGLAFCVHPPDYQAGIVQNTDNAEALESVFPYFECLTSGSDGQPKRIRRSHESWIASFCVNAQLAQITTKDSYAIIGRLSHSLPLYAALEAAYLGADIHPLTELRADRQLQAIASQNCTVLYATPTQLRLLCSSVNAKNLPTLQRALRVRAIFCGGGKLDLRTRELVEQVFTSADIREFYGASETSFITMSDKQTPAGSVGKAYPRVELLIKGSIHEYAGVGSDADADSGSGSGSDAGADFDANERGVGEIWVKSPYLFHSYAGATEHAAHWLDGYVSVGEIGYLDDAGHLFLSGRQSRRVNISDILVYPEEIETALREHTAVNQCAVIAVDDQKRGSVLIAVIQAKENAALKQALLGYLRQRVGSLKAPRDILFVSTLPLLASGKPDLIAIEQHALAAATDKK